MDRSLVSHMHLRTMLHDTEIRQVQCILQVAIRWPNSGQGRSMSFTYNSKMMTIHGANKGLDALYLVIIKLSWLSRGDESSNAI